MNLTLDGLKCGAYREIRRDEWSELKELIRNSSSETITETGGHRETAEVTRMKELVQKLNEAAKAYYQEDREIMSNRSTTRCTTNWSRQKK